MDANAFTVPLGKPNVQDGRGQDIKENDLQKSTEASESQQGACHTGRAMRKDGQRNLHVSSFTVSSEKSGDQTDDGKKTSIRVKEPPGGKSSGFW